MSPRKTAAKRSRRGAPTKVKVMVVDDHPIWRATLKNLLERGGTAKVVAEAGDGVDVVERASESGPEVIVMDINLPTLDGIEATRRLLSKFPSSKVLVLASSDERAQVVRAIRAGASGYLVKTAAPKEVVQAVARLRAGELVFPPALADIVLSELRGGGGAEMPSVAIAIPSVLERTGCRELIEQAGLQVVSAVGSLDDLEDLDRADVTVVDEELFRSAGSSGAAERLGSAAILVLTKDPDADHVLGVLSDANAGAGYMSKDRLTDPDELVQAIVRVSRGDSVVDSQVVNRLVELPENVRSLDGLTDREREVLAMMAEGHTNPAIAERMFLGLKTVEAHVRSIFIKLGLEPDADVHRRVLAVIAYLRSSS
jgi:DNA-binding NarL/FixJ family response regulator